MVDELTCMVVADDFTGSCDTGLQFAAAGYRTYVGFDLDPTSLAEAKVGVLDTETRNCTAAEARRRLQSLTPSLSAVRTATWYKKVDSTVRGPIAAEIVTLMEILGAKLCLLAPAYPSSGRITVGGHQLLNGVPVHRTEMATDPGAPIRQSYLSALFADEKVEVRRVDLGVVEAGSEAIVAAVSQMSGAKRMVVVLDAAGPADLREIARAGTCMPCMPLMCGSAGLAAGLLSTLSGGDPAAMTIPANTAPFLVVAGSTRELTTKQLLRGERDLGVERIQLPRNSGRNASVLAAYAGGKDVILALQADLPAEQMSTSIEQLAAAALRLCEHGRPSGILVTGGWTAVTLMRAFKASGVEVLGKVEDCVPLCRLRGGPFAGTHLITKAGALGSERIVSRAATLVRPSAGPSATADDPKLPILAITMGDPGGVGAEVIVKALSAGGVYSWCRPLVLGHPEILRENLKYASTAVEIVEIDVPEAAQYRRGCIDVLNPIDLDLTKIAPGQVSAEAGKGAVEWVKAGVDLAMARRIDGIVTAPLNKEAMNRAGYPFAGHTELLGERTQTRDYRMLLAADKLKVVHVTVHVALSKVPECLSIERVFQTIRLGGEALVDMGCPKPRIAVSGLNPHAGEHGLFGDEDALAIAPAVEQAVAGGWDVSGPLPGDTLFHRAHRGEFDLAVAMYHDQGHIPIKLVAFADAVNVTLGLPIIRTSVDHGTAFDIVGQGIADPQNMVEAIRTAAKLACSRAGRSG